MERNNKGSSVTFGDPSPVGKRFLALMDKYRKEGKLKSEYKDISDLMDTLWREAGLKSGKEIVLLQPPQNN